MSSILLTFVAFVATFMTIPILIRFAKQTNLYAHRNDRTSHHADIPCLGGIAIFLGMTFSVLLLTPNEKFHELQYLLATQFVLFFLGLKDDIFVLSARLKLLIQVLCAITLISLADVRISDFYGVLGIHGLTSIESAIFTTIVIVGLINAFNLIDGINCLAGLIAISATSFLAYWFSINGFTVHAGVAFAVIGSTLAFLYYNRTPAKIFMGDTGSLLLGLTITYLTIEFINLNHTTPNLSLQMRSAPAMAVGIMFVPILDTLRVTFIRLQNRKNPFNPDKNHLHHILIDAGCSHMKASLILFGINVTAVAGAFIFNHYSGKIVIPLVYLLSYTAINLISFTFIKSRVDRKLKLVA